MVQSIDKLAINVEFACAYMSNIYELILFPFNGQKMLLKLILLRDDCAMFAYIWGEKNTTIASSDS